MAKIIPDGWREMEATGAAQREIETLAQIAEALPDSYTVYHGVHWTRVKQGFPIFGEIDFAIVNRAGKILLIEQKSGFLTETDGGLVKQYSRKEKNVPSQMARSADSLRNRLNNPPGGDKISIDSMLYCPDYIVKTPGSAGIDPSRIVDASRKDRLSSIITAILPDDEPVDIVAQKVHHFMSDQLSLVPEVHAIAGQANMLYTRLSGGLAQWGRCIDCDPFRLRVVGTAGSGKTQLALAVYRDTIARGKKPLYVCYNRPLADHITQVAPREGVVATYHQLCEQIYRASGRVPDFTQPGMFQELEAFFTSFQPDDLQKFDAIIVDEGQDFHAEWRDNLLKLLHPDGQAWWLEDPMQNLRMLDPVELQGWVTLRSDINYRSPQDILHDINRLVPLDRPVEAGSPLSGSEVEILTYNDTAELIEQTKHAIVSAIGAGFKRDMIAIVSYRGREKSALASFTKLGPHALRGFTGKYDLLGDPIHTEGEIVIDSVYRFKGQAAPCVIYTEIDFDTLDELAARKLFVGMTRATMKLYLLISERSAQTLLARMEQE